MKNADKPINPLQHAGLATCESNFNSSDLHGLTKREYFAGLAMNGYLASYAGLGTIRFNQIDAERCIQMADELLKELDK
jgi:hypothetical protein